MIKKLSAELFGTATLVYLACGVATVTLGHWHGVGNMYWGTNAGLLVTALAFGLVLTGLIYAIGSISGCHINPAVTMGMLVAKRMAIKDALGYWVAQFAGGIVGALGLWVTLKSSSHWLRTHDGMGQNGYGVHSTLGVSMGGAFIVEVVLTAIFVLVILALTEKGAPSAVAGVVIGLTLTLVHLFGIPVTGTSVNPARSFGPALIVGHDALHQVWLFIVAPLVGGALAALVHRFLRSGE
jgi:aquaporin Z